MRLHKRILATPAVQAVLCWLVAQYIRLVYCTTRWEYDGKQYLEEAQREDGPPVVYCFWHGRLLMMPALRARKRPMHVMISEHRDGELIARVSRFLGVGAVRGSSRRGATKALRGALGSLKEGFDLGITPDGPRGPRYHAQGGAVALARLSGASLLPVTYATSRARLLQSWDRFLLALPFARGYVCCGEPITVPREAGDVLLEDKRRALEEALNALTRQADQLAGLPQTEPDQQAT